MPSKVRGRSSGTVGRVTGSGAELASAVAFCGIVMLWVYVVAGLDRPAGHPDDVPVLAHKGAGRDGAQGDLVSARDVAAGDGVTGRHPPCDGFQGDRDVVVDAEVQQAGGHGGLLVGWMGSRGARRAAGVPERCRDVSGRTWGSGSCAWLHRVSGPCGRSADDQLGRQRVAVGGRSGGCVDAVQDPVDGQLDIRDLDACRSALIGADAVVHLGAVSDPAAGWNRLLPANVVGTYNIARAAVDCGVRRLVLASSLHAMSAAPPGYQMRSEDQPRPGNLYGATKAWT